MDHRARRSLVHRSTNHSARFLFLDKFFTQGEDRGSEKLAHDGLNKRMEAASLDMDPEPRACGMRGDGRIRGNPSTAFRGVVVRASASTNYRGRAQKLCNGRSGATFPAFVRTFVRDRGNGEGYRAERRPQRKPAGRREHGSVHDSGVRADVGA